MLRLVVAHALSLLVVLHAGCATKELPPPSGTTTTILPADSRRGTLSTRLGLEIRIEFPAPEAGHVWRIIQHDPRYLRPLEEIGAPSPETGRTTVAFHAIRTGRTQLRFVAVPANGGAEVLPVDSYDIVVAIE